ncbi:hypothetical protein AB0N17_44635 [Streptomyces sp. NPDC051133]|uniref:hypothetical protein n=1 Tax=Streptomyces sp. NPDC051133 TaxID=3155521 RepID=UPI00341705D5
MKRPPIKQVQALPGADFARDAGTAAPTPWLPSQRGGWPGSVAPPSSERFVQSAKDWLFSLGPTRWRFIPMLNRLPVLLARVVRSHLEAGMASATLNSRTAQESLGHLDLQKTDLEDFVDFSEQEYSQLQALALQVRVVEAELERRYRRQ